MKIEIKVVKENEDGSADAEIYLDEEAKGMLIRKAIIDVLIEAANNSKENLTPKEQQ
jgi:hypothetical protein